MSHFGHPGIGGSLGVCALCGDTFLIEVCLGGLLPNKKVFSFTADGIADTMYAHETCAKQFVGKEIDVLTLPEKSPLRRAFVAKGVCFRCGEPDPCGCEPSTQGRVW